MSSEESLPDIAATHALAARVAGELSPGDVIALVGDLGAGKTEFTRGLARALGVPKSVRVTSPSYLLLNTYAMVDPPLAHFDAYFMESEDDLMRAGFGELIATGHAVVVEWAERVADAMPPEARWLELKAGDGPEGRRVVHGRPTDGVPRA